MSEYKPRHTIHHLREAVQREPERVELPGDNIVDADFGGWPEDKLRQAVAMIEYDRNFAEYELLCMRNWWTPDNLGARFMEAKCRLLEAAAGLPLHYLQGDTAETIANARRVISERQDEHAVAMERLAKAEERP